MTAQLSFDLDATLPKPVLPPWTGSFLAYHEGYRDPEEHLAAMERWIEEHGSFGSHVRSHMWHAGWGAAFAVEGHTFTHLMADARRNGDEWDASIYPTTPDELVHQVICTTCKWHHVTTSERGSVEAWHDHALPGWRDLPVMPLHAQPAEWAKPGKTALAWIEANQPVEWQRPGCPIRTERKEFATRHVPKRSPFGGYDLAYVGGAS